jgi:WD40 repeat protein
MDGQRKALIVANDVYDHEGLRHLRSAAADAEALAGVLGDTQIGGFAVDVARNRAAHDVGAQIEDLFSESRPDDVLLLHFSCHGLKDESGELYFATRNTRPNRLGSTAVSAAFVQRCIRASRSRSIVLLLDCCYGGAFSQGVTVRASGDVNLSDSFPVGRLGGGRGRAVITASSSIEYAFEGDQLAEDHAPTPSVFTSALVEGLATGNADRDEDGWVSLNELYDYVFDRVREQNPRQTPSRDVEMQGELYLARSRRRRIRPLAAPPDLQAAMADANMFTRLGAASELRSRLLGENLAAAVGAHEALTQIASTDIRYVAEAAEAALREAEVRPDEAELHFGQVRQGSGPVRRMVHLLGPPVARACTFEPSDRWIRVEERPDGLEVSVDTSRAGDLHGHLTLKSPIGEAQIPILAEVIAKPPPAPAEPPPAIAQPPVEPPPPIAQPFPVAQPPVERPPLADAPPEPVEATAKSEPPLEPGPRSGEPDAAAPTSPAVQPAPTPASPPPAPRPPAPAPVTSPPRTAAAAAPEAAPEATPSPPAPASASGLVSGSEPATPRPGPPSTPAPVSAPPRPPPSALDGGGRRTWRSRLPQTRRSRIIAGLIGLAVLIAATITTAALLNGDGGGSDSTASVGSAASTRSVAFSPNGKIVASAGDRGTIRLWNPATGQPIGQPLNGHSGSITSLAFSPDGRLLASGSYDYTVRLWDPATGRPVGQPLTGHTSYVRAVAFSPDGKRLASAGDDQSVRLWDPATGQPAGKPLTGHIGHVRAIAFRPDGKRLASGGDDQSVRLWDPATGQPVGQPFRGPDTGNVVSVAWSPPDGKWLVSTSSTRRLQLWYPDTGDTLIPHADAFGIQAMTFSPKGDLFAGAIEGTGTVRVWNPATWDAVGQPLTGHTGEITSLAFSPDGKILAVGGGNDTVYLWNTRTGRPAGQLPPTATPSTTPSPSATS